MIGQRGERTATTTISGSNIGLVKPKRLCSAHRSEQPDILGPIGFYENPQVYDLAYSSGELANGVPRRCQRRGTPEGVGQTPVHPIRTHDGGYHMQKPRQAASDPGAGLRPRRSSFSTTSSPPSFKKINTLPGLVYGEGRTKSSRFALRQSMPSMSLGMRGQESPNPRDGGRPGSQTCIATIKTPMCPHVITLVKALYVAFALRLGRNGTLITPTRA